MIKKTGGLFLTAFAVLATLSCAGQAPATAAPNAGMVESNIVYNDDGGEKQLLDAHIPDGGGPFPVLIIVHGGGWSGGDKEGDIVPAMAGALTNFTWFAINYRLAPTNRWPACYDDVLNAIRWAKQHAPEYKGDPERVGIMGYSAGGHLATLAGTCTNLDTRVQAVVGLAPPTDIARDALRRGSMEKWISIKDLLGRDVLDSATLGMMTNISPINHVQPGLPPFLLVQGDADKTVPIIQTSDFESTLKRNNIPCDMIVIQGAPHRISNWDSRQPGWAGQVADWLQQHLDKSPESNGGKKIRIVLVGDSTVTDRSGWGLGFKQFVDTNKVDCINVSAGGRSSMSFMREGRWTNALALKGDYYLIQFGHNNQPGKPGRSTDMPTFVRNMEQYVDDARAIGAQPVLVTPLSRREWDRANPGKIKSSLEPYAADVRRIAAEKNVPLIDLHARSLALYEQLGREKCYEFSPTKVVDGKTAYDGTHLAGIGRVMFARLVVEELRKAVPQLSPVLLAEPRDPMPALPEDGYNAIVAEDVSASYTNLQLAINAAPDDGTQPYRILLKPGVYKGQFIVPKTKNHIEIFGEDVSNTIVTYDLNVRETNASTDLRFKGTGIIVLGDNFQAQNLTIRNTSGDHGQALALRVDGDRAVFDHCRIQGWQDTLMVNVGRDYFTNCYIAGRVDFIYGSATAVFQNCEIHSKDGGHVTAANTPQDQPYGFVFMNCRLTGDSTPWLNPESNRAGTNVMAMADLGRPWRPYASVTYLNCEMGAHIKPEGWNNWRNPANESTARYAEYNSSGPGANPGSRVTWSKQLTGEEADKITMSSVLGGDDGWDPIAQMDPAH